MAVVLLKREEFNANYDIKFMIWNLGFEIWDLKFGIWNLIFSKLFNPPIKNHKS